MDAHFFSDGNHICTVNQPFIAMGFHLHLIVDAFEYQMRDTALNRSRLWADQVNILWPNYHVHRTIAAKAHVYAGELYPKNFNELILYHDAVQDVAISYEVGHKRVLRFIIYILSLIHI